MDSRAIIAGVMARHDAHCTVDEFHEAVNVTFHNFESEVYDTEHASMWESLPLQFSLLVNDWLATNGGNPPRALRLLDIGCGTGLATDSILKTQIGKNIETICLLDTSPAMLRRVSDRAAQWPVAPTIKEGLLDSLEGEAKFDLIVTCSVLHHVPDLPSFFKEVRRLQADNGVFLHLQDPNGDFLADAELKQRIASYSKRHLPDWVYRLAPGRILGRLYRELIGRQGQDYISKTNRTLLEQGTIQSPLTVHEIFQITDIHVQDGEDISIAAMRTWMPGCDLVSSRYYSFRGEQRSDLPQRLREEEDRLVAGRARNGQYAGAIWKLRSAMSQ
jgi:SAM-dependent methyltransferase